MICGYIPSGGCMNISGSSALTHAVMDSPNNNTAPVQSAAKITVRINIARA